MKFLLVFFLAMLAGAFCHHWDKEGLECVEEHKFDKKTIETLNEPLEKPIPEDHKDLNDFLECTWKKMGLLTDDKIHWDKMEEHVWKTLRRHIHKDDEITTITTMGIVKTLIDKCHEKHLHGDTTGKTIVKIRNCLGKRMKCLVTIFED